MINRQSYRRVFTREEDELILANAQQRMSLRQLLLTLHCAEETAAYRAAQLGVELTRQKRVGGQRERRYRSLDPRDQTIYPGDGRHDIPHTGKDLLLQWLQYEYGEQRGCGYPPKRLRTV